MRVSEESVNGITPNDPEWEYEDDEGDDEEDIYPEEDCGRTHDGTCMYAGSEFCDWDCPLERMAWRKK